jgi:hypothetical protein
MTPDDEQDPLLQEGTGAVVPTPPATVTSSSANTVSRVVLAQLTHTDLYSAWRYAALAAIMAAASDIIKIRSFIAELNDTSITIGELDTDDKELVVIDARLFSAITSAIRQHKDYLELLRQFEVDITFGNGRQALRILDRHHLHSASRLGLKAAVGITHLKLQRGQFAKLGDFLTQFQLAEKRMR